MTALLTDQRTKRQYTVVTRPGFEFGWYLYEGCVYASPPNAGPPGMVHLHTTSVRDLLGHPAYPPVMGRPSWTTRDAACGCDHADTDPTYDSRPSGWKWSGRTASGRGDISCPGCLIILDDLESRTGKTLETTVFRPAYHFFMDLEPLYAKRRTKKES